MKIKIFSFEVYDGPDKTFSESYKEFEEKVNSFLSDESIHVVNIKTDVITSSEFFNQFNIILIILYKELQVIEYE